MLAHAVYFTLKDRSPAAAAALVASCREHLTGHPGEVAFSVGTLRRLRPRGQRPRLGRRFSLIVFESQEAHDAYQTAPRHEQFIAANATTWAKVRVFDADLAAWQAREG